MTARGEGSNPERLAALTAFLVRHEALWRPRPFADLRVGWRADHPALSEWLVALEPAAIDALEHALYTQTPWPDEAGELGWWRAEGERLAAAPRAPGDAIVQGRRRLDWQVPGRKWRQIEAFAGAVLAREASAPARWVDWCAGKGHLGRTLGAVRPAPVTLIELLARLAPTAQRLAARQGVEIAFQARDALSPGAESVLGRDTIAVGLHACGALGDRLLEHAVTRDVAAVALAPCCYHKAHGDHRGRRPLSARGRASGLVLPHTALRLATADEVVARGSLRRARRRENAFRLGLDLLLREATGVDAYRPLGTLPAPLLAGDFEAFCVAVAADRGLPLPAGWRPDAALAAGVARARAARGLGLVRAAFRRPLEAWLVADRACFLEEAGRPAQVATFCPPTVTPRNLMIWSPRA